MEANMKMASNDSQLTSPTFQTMPKNAYLSRTRINPTAMTSGTHLNLHREFRSAVHLTHTTMPATEWLKRKRLNEEEKTVNRKVRDVVHITATSDYFIEAVKSWRGVRPLFHKSQSFHPTIQITG